MLFTVTDPLISKGTVPWLVSLYDGAKCLNGKRS
jgi:hypothetical protein